MHYLRLFFNPSLPSGQIVFLICPRVCCMSVPIRGIIQPIDSGKYRLQSSKAVGDLNDFTELIQYNIEETVYN